MEEEQILEISKKIFIEIKNTHKVNTPQDFGLCIAYLYNMGLADNEEYNLETSFIQDELPTSALDVYESFHDNIVNI